MAYAAESDCKIIFGKHNIEKWADVDNAKDAAAIESRIEWALALAEETVNNRLRGGPYAVPFSEPAPLVVTDVTARLAGVLLYEARGVTDFSPNGDVIHQLKHHKDHVQKFFEDVHKGRLRLHLPQRGDTFPTAGK